MVELSQLSRYGIGEGKLFPAKGKEEAVRPEGMNVLKKELTAERGENKPRKS